MNDSWKRRNAVWFDDNYEEVQLELPIDFKTEIKIMTTMNGFVEAAQKGVVTVEFEKINNGGLRVMPCTLNHEVSGGAVPEILEQRDESDNIAVWCIDKEAWRSFRVSTVVRWYEGMSK